MGGQERILGGKCQAGGTKAGGSKVVQGSLEMRKSSNKETWGMVGIHRDAEDPRMAAEWGGA